MAKTDNAQSIVNILNAIQLAKDTVRRHPAPSLAWPMHTVTFCLSRVSALASQSASF